MGFGVGADMWWFAFYVSLRACVCNFCSKNNRMHYFTLNLFK